jgi:hypothetical protein
MYHQMKAQPDNLDTIEQQNMNEHEVSAAFFKYLVGTGPFKDFNDECETYMATMVSSKISCMLLCQQLFS